MHFDYLVGGGGDEDLQLSSLVEGTIEQREQALMRDIWSILSRVFLELVGDVVGMVITVQKHVLMLLVLGYF